LLNAVLNLLFPMGCVVCDALVLDWRSGPLCGKCESAIRPMEQPFCERCGSPTPLPNVHCGACLAGLTEFDLGRSALRFNDDLRRVIHNFKYNDRVSLARPLGRALRRCLEVEPFEADLVVPVPLHRKRERQRGFNQAALLAARLNRPVDLNVLRRSKNSLSQTGLTRTERKRNVRGAFECPRRIRGSVLIVDDVQTTGATINEVARVLKRGGASRVEAISVARVELDGSGIGEQTTNF
jgi:ComF family protein